jgi:hypothetical protein
MSVTTTPAPATQVEPAPTPRKAAVPALPEVVAAQMQVDSCQLRHQAEVLREELEPLVDRIVPLLARITVLMEWAGDVADAIDNAPGDATWETYEAVMEQSGVRELQQMFGRLAAAFPKDSVRMENL